MSRENWAWKDGWPHHDPNANQSCPHCKGVGILFDQGVVAQEVECICIPDCADKEFLKKRWGIE